jgi:glucosylceramidase
MKINLVTTTYKNDVKETFESSLEFGRDNNTEMAVVNIYPQMEYQTFDGFGGAITEAAAFTYSQMSEESKKKMVEAYFGESGARYNIVRTHIDSCDFAVDMYEAMSDPTDREFKSFTLERDEKYILPLLDAAEATAGKKLSVVMSPWSPPAFMKTNGQRTYGGSLKPEYRKFWADYICHYIKEYRAKGYQIDYLTIQNEPNAVQTWDSCTYTGQQEKEFLSDFLYPSIQENDIKDLGVVIWDHNKERVFERACEIIDYETDKMVQGIGFHWYTGDHFDALRLVSEKFPDKKLMFTEGCVEYSRFSETAQLEKAQMYGRDIIGNINAGMNSFIDWNIYLNAQGGPNHVNNFCDAPIMCDIDKDVVDEKLSFDYIKHFSHYIEPGAKRIASTKYSPKLEMTTLKNPDGSIVTVLMNISEEDLEVNIRLNGEVVKITAPAGSITTGLIK